MYYNRTGRKLYQFTCDYFNDEKRLMISFRWFRHNFSLYRIHSLTHTHTRTKAYINMRAALNVIFHCVAKMPPSSSSSRSRSMEVLCAFLLLFLFRLLRLVAHSMQKVLKHRASTGEYVYLT